MGRVILVSLVSLVLTACADQTGILVQISSTDIVVPSDVDGLTIRAHTPDSLMVDRSFPIRTSWPQSLLIRPAAGEALGDVRITVTGTLGGAFVVQRFVMTQFIPGQVRRVDVQLTRDCLGVTCAEDVDCVAGTCQGMGVDGGIHDAGPIDASVDDGGMDGGTDAASDDVGTDAPPSDAGNDGGHDAAGPCAGASCLGRVVISEMSPAMTNEFIELYNRSGQAADVSGCSVMYAGDPGAPVMRGTIAAGTSIPSHGYLLLASVGYTGTPAPDQRAWSVGFLDTNAAVAIQCGATVLDLFGYGATADHHEGAPSAPIDTATQPLSSYERKANASSTAASLAPAGSDATAGNGYDTDDNLGDFVIRVARDPQSSASAHEP